MNEKIIQKIKLIHSAGNGDIEECLWTKSAHSSRKILSQLTASLAVALYVSLPAWSADSSGRFIPIIVQILDSGCASAEAGLVKDINEGPSTSTPFEFYNSNGTWYFAANDGSAGFELWKSNGTTASTKMVKDINLGLSSGFKTGFGSLGNSILFGADDGTNGVALWKSDGSDGGTEMIKALGSSQISPQYWTNFGDTVFFTTTNTSYTSRYLWRTDGTADGTRSIWEVNNLVNPTALFNLNGRLVMMDKDGEIWTWTGAEGNTDGTQKLISNVSPSSIQRLQDGGILYFVLGNNQLWKTDGAVTTQIKAIRQSGNAYITNLTRGFDGRIYFKANNGIHGDELWVSNGTGVGTMMLKDVRTGPTSGFKSGIVSTNEFIYFGGDDGIHDTELWKSDGTPDGTVLVKDINPSGMGGFANFAQIGNTVFFSATNGINGHELWKSDGTAEGTEMVSDIYDGPTGSFPNDLTSASSQIFFTATDSPHGKEVWTVCQ